MVVNWLKQTKNEEMKPSATPNKHGTPQFEVGFAGSDAVSYTHLTLPTIQL